MRRRKARSKPRPARDVLVQFLNGVGLLPLVAQVRLAEAWPAVVGAAVALHTWTEGVVDGEVRVAVDHPVWKQELHLRQNEVLARLSRSLGTDTPVVRMLILVRSRPAPAPAQQPPAAEAQAFGEQVAGPAVDDTLRNAVAHAAAAHAQARRWRRGNP